MSEHIASDCVERLVDCDFHEFGCDAKVAYREQKYYNF